VLGLVLPTKRKLHHLQKNQNNQSRTSYENAHSQHLPNQSQVLKLIEEVEQLLDREIPKAVYQPAPHVTVLDIEHCLRSHLSHVKAQWKNPYCQPYINRLIHLKNYVIRITKR
jgi:hypothetical protein